MKRYRRLFRQLSEERAAVYLEYALLLAFVIVIGCSPLMPGGPIYEYIRSELVLRIFMISLPIF